MLCLYHHRGLDGPNFWKLLADMGICQAVIAALPHDAHPMGTLVASICALSSCHPDANPALQVQTFSSSAF